MTKSKKENGTRILILKSLDKDPNETMIYTCRKWSADFARKLETTEKNQMGI